MVATKLVATENLITFLYRFIILALFLIYLQSTLISAFLDTIDTLLLIDSTIGSVFRFLPHTHHSIRFLRFPLVAQHYPRI